MSTTNSDRSKQDATLTMLSNSEQLIRRPRQEQCTTAVRVREDLDLSQFFDETDLAVRDATAHDGDKEVPTDLPPPSEEDMSLQIINAHEGSSTLTLHGKSENESRR